MLMPIFAGLNKMEVSMRKSFYRLIVVLCLSLSLILTGNSCSQPGKALQVQRLQHNFDLFMNDLFINEVQSDTLSLNYSLANPENYGIEPKETTLGKYNIDKMSESLALKENYLNRLMSFDYNSLSADQKLTYDIVKNYLEMDLNSGDFLYYNECLGPTTGIQAQLPILLAEYTFHDKEELDEYIRLLSCVYDYFEEIVRFEREKSERGLFMNDAVALRIISQCEAFIEDPESNFLIEYFNEKISNYDGLTKEEKTYYKALNKEAVLSDVIPAYQMLIDALYGLLGTGTNKAGLYYYPEGQAYYEHLAKYLTGSDKSMEDMAKMLEAAIRRGIVDITTLTLEDTKLVDKYLAFNSFPITNPEEIISDLKKDIAKDFPAAVPVNCNIKYVPPSLSEYLSPAMYLIPPIDNYTNNNIYINGNDKKTLSMIYTTVAHEGYPGHLYQCVYFRSRKPAPIRNLLNFVGYDEGWATYVELYSYYLAGIDENLAHFMEANNIVILCMYARADIGIHYEGWTKSTVVDYVTNYIGDPKIAEVIYNTLLEEPAIYLPYAVGYLEIMELRNKAEQLLGDDFVAKDFHEFLLNIGPAQFDIIETYMNQWINNYIKR